MLRGAAWGTPAILMATAAPAFATTSEPEPAGPQVYRADHYLSGGQLQSNVYFIAVPGAIGYAARLDDGEWLPVTIQVDWGEYAYGSVNDTTCGTTGCRYDRTVQMRAYTTEGPGTPGNIFTSTYYNFGG